MQRDQDERRTAPLGGQTQQDDAGLLAGAADRREAVQGIPAQAAGAPANVRMMRPGMSSGAMAAVQPGTQLSNEELELERIREILVGPHMRDHERRLRMMERNTADLRASSTPGDWRTQVEAAIERAQQASAAQSQALQQEQAHRQAMQAELAHERQARAALEQQLQHMQQTQQSQPAQPAAVVHSGADIEPVRAELMRERQAREAQAQDAERAIAQLTARMDQEREEHEVHMRELQSLRLEQQAQRAELTREREAHDDLGTRHAQAIAAMATQVDQQHEEHADQHQQSAADLDARLVRERQAHAQQVERLEAAHGERLTQLVATHNGQVEQLHQLVADAERALVSMQAEREHLAGLLAELGMHLVRHAASPAAARADDDSQTFLKAAAWWRRKPRN